MNTLYALMIVTTLGVSEGYTFASLEECNKASERVRDSFCVRKIPVDARLEIDKMFSLLQYMQTKMNDLHK